MKKNHSVILRSTLLAATALVGCAGAQAAITCNLSSNGFSSAYVPENPGTNITAASFTMTCTRSALNDATSQAYTVKVNNGLNPAGQNNQAASGASRIRYDVFTNSTCATQWKGGTSLGGTIALAAVGVPASQTVSFWGCIPASQTTVPAGTFVDTVTMTPSIGNTATFPVSIVTPSSCSITASPTRVSFNYLAFQATAATANTGFAATCTSRLPYTLSLDATSGVLNGLSYSLSLSASSNIGNGLAQAYTINGTVASGQSGTCATSICSATEARTLTITY